MRLPLIASLSWCAALYMALGSPAAAQLRPLDPLEWRVFDPGQSVVAEVGAGWYEDQRASLAGTVGRLQELGNFRAVWRTGRTALEVSGTMLRLFEDQAVFAPPAGDARASLGSRRDAGDFRIATAVRLTPQDRPLTGVLRFGTRLPTTDNLVGLERDRTDFFALVAGQLHADALRLSAETGVGIHGTRDSRYEQSDVWIFALAGEYETPVLTPSVSLLGHMDGLSGWTIRGNEELAELRLGLRAGSRLWLRGEWIHGLTAFSPAGALLLTVGARH